MIETIAAPPPHGGQRLLVVGAPLDEARGALVMLHGRGATAESILSLAEALRIEDLALLAPAAARNVWYPARFLEPLAANEPYLSSALAAVHHAVERAAGAVGHTRVAILGFSQGACLTLEYGARHPRRYAALVGLSGGLIGPDGLERHSSGSLEQTPVFLGCSDVDFHIPVHRVHDAAATLKAMGAAVDTRIYPGMGHTVNEDEVEAVSRLLDRIGRGADDPADRDPFGRTLDEVTETLGTDLAALFALRPDGSLIMRASRGWTDGLVGRMVVAPGTGSQAGYTIQTGGPVVIADLRTETRFRVPDALLAQGAISGLSTIVGPPERPWGILATHQRRARTFTQDDIARLIAIVARLAPRVD